MKCTCGGSTSVESTVQKPEGPMRRRKCSACSRHFATMEYEINTPGAGAHNQVVKKVAAKRKPIPKPDANGLYTPPDADEVRKRQAEIKNKKIELRRNAEDRRARVPDYFIEEDE